MNLRKLIANRYILFTIIVIANVIILQLLLTFVPLLFDCTNDVAMCYIANGKFFGTHEPRLVFINAIFGELLCWLYGTFTGVEWYVVMFLAIHVFSFSVIVYSVLKTIQNKYLKSLLLIFSYTIWCRFIVGFQFTTTAGLLCLAGCILLTGKHPFTRICGVLVITIASMLRFNMAAFVGVVFSPLIVYTFAKDYKKYLYIFLLFSLVLTCRFVNHYYYSSPEWQAYKEYNKQRGSINDNPNAGVWLSKSVDGVSRNDILMVLGTEQDPSVTDANVLSQVNHKIQNKTKWSKFKKTYQLKFFAIPLALIGLLAVVFFIFAKNGIRWIPVITFAVLLIFLIYISVNSFLKPRAVIPVLVSITFILCYCYNLESSRNNVLLWSVFAFCACLEIQYLVETVQTGERRQEMQAIWNGQKEMISKHDNVVLWPSDLCESGINPFELKDNDIRYIASGWMLKYPKQDYILQNHKELLSKEIGIMLTKERKFDRYVISRYKTSLLEHYGIAVKDSVMEENDDYRYYLLVEDNK